MLVEKPVLLGATLLCSLLGCGAPSAPQETDFEQRLALHTCSRPSASGGSGYPQKGEPVLVVDAGRSRIHMFEKFQNSSGLIVYGPDDVMVNPIEVPKSCLLEFSSFSKIDQMRESFWPLPDAPEDVSLAEMDSPGGEIVPARYVKFHSSGAVEYGTHADKVVDDSELPNYIKSFGVIHGQDGYFIARIGCAPKAHPLGCLYISGTMNNGSVTGLFGTH